MQKSVYIRQQTVKTDDVKWAALNRQYEEPIPSMEAVSQAVEYVLEYLTTPEEVR